MREVGDALTDGAKQGVLHRRPSLVNLQCDVDHPTQSLADLAWLEKHFGSLEALRGKKLAMTWAYSPSYGKPLSVPQGIIGLMTRFGMKVRLAHPEGYGLIPEVVELAEEERRRERRSVRGRRAAWKRPSTAPTSSTRSPGRPYRVMERRTELLKKSDRDGLESLEKECLANNAKFKAWECDRAKMNLTAGKKALYMHCLPADISGVSCEAGEVSAEVFDAVPDPHLPRGGYKPFVIGALMFLERDRRTPSARKLRRAIVESRAPRTRSRPEESSLRHSAHLVISPAGSSIRRPGSHRRRHGRSAASEIVGDRRSPPFRAAARAVIPTFARAARPVECSNGRRPLGRATRRTSSGSPGRTTRPPGSSAAQPPRDPAGDHRRQGADRRHGREVLPDRRPQGRRRLRLPRAAPRRAASSTRSGTRRSGRAPGTTAAAAPSTRRCSGCTAVAILPENMSQERFEWLAAHRRRGHRDAGLRDRNVKEIYDKCWELKKDPVHVDLQPVRGVREPDLALQRHRPRRRGGLPRPRGPKAPPRRLGQRHRERRDDRRGRLPEDRIPRREDRRHRGAPVPDPAHERLRRPPDRGDRRQARPVGPQRPEHRRRGRHRRRGLHAAPAALQRAGGPGVPRRGRRAPADAVGKLGLLGISGICNVLAADQGREVLGARRERRDLHRLHRQRATCTARASRSSTAERGAFTAIDAARTPHREPRAAGRRLLQGADLPRTARRSTT